MGVFGLKIGVFAQFGSLFPENWKSHFRFLEAFREIPGPSVDAENLSNISCHSFEKRSIEICPGRPFSPYFGPSGRRVAPGGLASRSQFLLDS